MGLLGVLMPSAIRSNIVSDITRLISNERMNPGTIVIYKTLYPSAETTTPLETVFKEAYECIPPKKLSFTIIDSVFQAWMSAFMKAHKEMIPLVKEGTKKDFSTHFVVDGLEWKGKMAAQICDGTKSKYLAINVRLPNDGFVYPSLRTLKPVRGNQHAFMVKPRHKAYRWVEVHGGEIAEKMPHLFAFFNNMLEEEVNKHFLHIGPLAGGAKTILNPEADFEFFFNFDQDNMDVKAFLKTKVWPSKLFRCVRTLMCHI